MGIGVQEMIWIFLILVLLFGAKKLPELAQGLGKGIREFKKATNAIDDEPGKSNKTIADEKKDAAEE